MSDPRIRCACCACPIADTCGLVCSARDERKALYDKLVAQTYAAGKALKYAEMFEGATQRVCSQTVLSVLTCVFVWRSGRCDRSGRHAVLDRPGPGVVPALRHMAGVWPLHSGFIGSVWLTLRPLRHASTKSAMWTRGEEGGECMEPSVYAVRVHTALVAYAGKIHTNRVAC